ncbi:hypothetical protein BS78_09G180200 [Paspalum vaginatum]|nr:hypothetical protein BS78_09G180200 [Paspalum vaginatum]
MAGDRFPRVSPVPARHACAAVKSRPTPAAQPLPRHPGSGATPFLRGPCPAIYCSCSSPRLLWPWAGTTIRNTRTEATGYGKRGLRPADTRSARRPRYQVCCICGIMHGQRHCQTAPGSKQNKRASPKGPNIEAVLDAGELPSPDSKQSKTGIGGSNQHPYMGSNVSRKHALFQVTGGASELKKLPTPIDLFEDECAFCHSFRTGQLHGPMLRYLKGRIVSMDEDSPSNAIYVHKKCLEWTPRVWFDGDIVMNLELEIRRASRLRCRRCGLLGAALGCFYDPCKKSFHVPCAVQITNCRWDVDERNVLCPEHVSETLLCDGVGRHAEQNDNSSSLRGSQCSNEEESLTELEEEGQQYDHPNTTSSFLSVRQCTYKDGSPDDNHRESQQTDQLNIPCPPSLPQSQPSQMEGISTSISRDGQQIDQLDTSSSCSLPRGGSSQHSDEGISKDHERVDQRQRAHKFSTSNLSLSKRCHPDKEGISNARQGEERRWDQTEKSSCPSDHLVLLGLSLSASEKDSLQEFACRTNAALMKEWAKNVTHVIVGKRAGTSWSRSFEALMATLLGKWVVHSEWITACLAMPPCPEAAYEVALGAMVDGPKKNRAAQGGRAPKLFSGLRFCLSAYMHPGNRDRTRDLVAAAGGWVLEKRDLRLVPKNSDGSPAARPYFVYEADAPREFSSRSLREEMEEAREHAAAGAQVISHHRVMDAVAAYDAGILNDERGVRDGLSTP